MVGLISQLANGVLLGGLYAVMALGLTTMFGVMRIVNFAYGTLFMLGAYVAYVVQSDLGQSFFVSLLAAMLVLFVLGTLLELGAFNPLRKSEERTVLLGLGIMLAGRGLLISHFGSDNKTLDSGVDGNVSFSGGVIVKERLFAFVLALLLLAVVALLVTRSPLGRTMRAVADDPDRASLLGISHRPVYAITFGAATALSAAAACLLAPTWQVSPTMDNPALLIGFAIVIVGGMGSMIGSTIAGILTGIVVSLGEAYVSQALAPAMPFLLLILVLVVRPEGLMGKKVRVA